MSLHPLYILLLFFCISAQLISHSPVSAKEEAKSDDDTDSNKEESSSKQEDNQVDSSDKKNNDDDHDDDDDDESSTNSSSSSTGITNDMKKNRNIINFTLFKISIGKLLGIFPSEIYFSYFDFFLKNYFYFGTEFTI